MANNRMSLRCEGCGAEIVISKRLGGGYYRSSVFSDDAFDAFLERHEACTLSQDAPAPPFTLQYENPNEY